MIFVLFSPHTQFLARFFSTQKRVNHSKKISTKQRKLPKTWFFNSLMRQNTINCTHHLSNLQIVFTFLTWRTLSTCQSVMWRISSSNNMSCGEISPHVNVKKKQTILYGRASLMSKPIFYKLCQYSRDCFTLHSRPIFCYPSHAYSNNFVWYT